jgi:hypothetical protein
MNERLPYEEQLVQKWDELSVPDEDMAWADMKRRLEKDDDDGFTPFWLRGCGFWGIAIVGLLAVVWWIVQHQKWFHTNQSASQQERTISPKSQKGNTRSDQIRLKKSVTIDDSASIPTKRHSINPKQSNSSIEHKPVSKKIIAANSKKIKPPQTQKGHQRPNQPQNVLNKETNEIDQLNEKDRAADSLKENGKTIVSQNKTDSTIRSNPDSLQMKTAQTLKHQKDSSQRNHFSFAAGLALHQQLPLAGQKLTPYNAEGRKESIGDYIPSVYFRMIRNKKWFIQAEFRYGAPQYNKEFLYQEKIDTARGNVTSTSLTKSFYHQLPLTFNYFINEHWSLGAGLTWNKFVSAISSQDVVHHNTTTGIDSFIVKDQIFSTKPFDSVGHRVTDSNFVNSYLQGVFETQYQWKRFSLGVRYSFGLQPYIKFTLPGGTQQQEKNQSVNIFVRYDLWRSKH